MRFLLSTEVSGLAQILMLPDPRVHANPRIALATVLGLHPRQCSPSTREAWALSQRLISLIKFIHLWRLRWAGLLFSRDAPWPWPCLAPAQTDLPVLPAVPRARPRRHMEHVAAASMPCPRLLPGH